MKNKRNQDIAFLILVIIYTLMLYISIGLPLLLLYVLLPNC